MTPTIRGLKSTGVTPMMRGLKSSVPPEARVDGTVELLFPEADRKLRSGLEIPEIDGEEAWVEDDDAEARWLLGAWRRWEPIVGPAFPRGTNGAGRRNAFAPWLLSRPP